MENMNITKLPVYSAAVCSATAVTILAPSSFGGNGTAVPAAGGRVRAQVGTASRQVTAFGAEVSVDAALRDRTALTTTPLRSDSRRSPV